MTRRVVFVTTGFDQVTNGPGVYAQNLWRFFADNSSIEFHLVAAESKIKHTNIHTLDQRPKGFGSAVYRAINDLANQVLRRLGPNTILHANMAHSVTPKLVSETNSIVQINDTEVCQWRPSLQNLRQYKFRRNLALCWRQQREYAVARQANVTVCNSIHTTDSVRSAYRLPDDQLKTIYKAIDLQPFNEAGNKPCERKAGEKPTIAFVGSNWRRKGLDVLLQSIKQLKRSGTSVELHVFGVPDSATREEFQALTNELQLLDEILFRGHVTRDRLPEELARFDLFVLPSREEALGLAVIEALATGIPVVTSSVGGLPEIVTSEACGQLVPVGDVLALAQAIEAQLDGPSSPQLRAKRQSAVERFGLQRLENELQNLYATVGQW